MTIPAIAPPDMVAGHPSGARGASEEWWIGACNCLPSAINSLGSVAVVRSRTTRAMRPSHGWQCAYHWIGLSTPDIIFVSWRAGTGSGGQWYTATVGPRRSVQDSRYARLKTCSDDDETRPGEKEREKTRNKKRIPGHGKEPLISLFEPLRISQPPLPALTSSERRTWRLQTAAICLIHH